MDSQPELIIILYFYFSWKCLFQGIPSPKSTPMYWRQHIYFNDSSLILTTQPEREIINQHTISFAGPTAENFRLAIGALEHDGRHTVIISGESRTALENGLLAVCHPIDAAGGVAFNEAGEILLIYRRGKWDLPKGKRDEGETMEECALREVMEETGLENLTLDSEIGDTYHIYTQYREQMLKRTAWYRMAGRASDKLNPQKAENIVDARWVKPAELGSYLANTYEAVRDILHVAGLSW